MNLLRFVKKLTTLVTLNLRKEYVSSLKESQILGTVTTDESGKGYLALDKNAGEFFVLQTDGREGYSLADPVFRSDDAMKTETIKYGKQSNRIYSFTADGVKEIKAKVSVKKQKKDDNTDESIRMEGLRKDVEKQGIDVSTIKAGIDALVQKNGENTDRVRDLTRDLEKSEQALADTEKKLRDREWELSQYQRENQQLKQQIYNLQHPQQSWDEPER